MKVANCHVPSAHSGNRQSAIGNGQSAIALAVALCLAAAAARCHAGPRWYDTYAEAQKIAVEFGRPMVFVFISERSQVRSIQRMFDKPPLRRFHRLFVFTYEMVIVKDRSISSPFFRKYPPQGMALRMPLVLIFFASPDEKVLYKMAGEPTTKSLAIAMGIALRKHGPVPDLKKLREAKRRLQRIDALLEKKDYPAAARLCVPIAKAKLTPKLLAEAKKRMATINDAVGKQLAEALALRDAKAYARAVPKLAAIQHDYPGLGAAKQAAAELDKLRKLPAAKAAFDALAKAEKVPGAASAARPIGNRQSEMAKLRRPAPEKDPDAFSDEELAALDELSQAGFDEDPPARQATANPKAQRLLQFARNWIANRKPEKARQSLNQILDLYPDSAAAEQARALLKKLD